MFAPGIAKTVEAVNITKPKGTTICSSDCGMYKRLVCYNECIQVAFC